MAAGEAREYGHAMVSRIAANQESGADLLGKLPDTTKMWMSHGDKLTAVPEVMNTRFFGVGVFAGRGGGGRGGVVNRCGGV